MRRRGLTLIELLVSLGLGMALSVLATSTFFQVRAIMRRTEARLALHNTARFVFQALRQDLMAMQQEGALYLECRADSHPELPAGDPRHDGEVRLVFLRARLDNDDFSYDGDGAMLNTDLVWTQWRWEQKRCALLAGSNQRARQWDSWGHWVSPDGRDFGNAAGVAHTYAALPQPRRAAGAGPQTLDDNAFGSHDGNDVGDYTDLERQTRPVTRNVSDLRLQLVLADGSTIDADASRTALVALDGVYVDGRAPRGGAARPHERRPRLVRLRFELTDASARLTQSFSFSFQVPSALPPA